MKFSDPFAVPNIEPRDHILFAASQLQGTRDRQEDYFLNYNDECFVVADGVGGSAHGDVAASLASETAIWGYKHIRQRPFYWSDKKGLLKRIFRTTNLTIWQKQKEPGFEDGLATTLLACIVTGKNVYIGSVGDTSAFLYRDGLIDQLTREERDSKGRLTRSLGMQRLGLLPQVRVEQFLSGDVVLLATDGVVDFVSEDRVREILEQSGNSAATLAQAAEALIGEAQKNMSPDNMTACLIKKLRI